MAKLNVATVQFALQSEPTVDAYNEHVEGLVRDAAARDAELVVLPELASTGLLGSIEDHEVTTATISSDYWTRLPEALGAIEEALVGMARRHGVVIVGGSHNRIDDAGNLRNTALLVHPDGRVETQDKVHLTPQEIALGTRGGDRLLVTKIGPFTAGVLICADIQFPELARHLVHEGVDLIVCPSLTWNRRGVHRVRTGCQARAIENQLYVVMSPLVGHSGLPADAPMHAVGRALVATPVDKTFGLNDGLLALAEDDSEQILIAELDRGLVSTSRANPEAPGLKLRNVDLYEQLRTARAGRPTDVV